MYPNKNCFVNLSRLFGRLEEEQHLLIVYMTSRNSQPTRARQEHVVSSASSVASVSSSYSVTSSFRHHNAPFVPTTPSAPRPILSVDTNHKPKTRGSVGIMVVGLGGANGTTLLAGILANRLNTQWRGPQGQLKKSNYNGCITQLKQRGKFGGVGFNDKIPGLADASMSAVGGWVSKLTQVGSNTYKFIRLMGNHLSHNFLPSPLRISGQQNPAMLCLMHKFWTMTL